MSTNMITTPWTRRPWKIAFLAGMASYLDAGAIVTTGIALVLYQHALNLNDITIGILSGLLTLCFAFGALVGGQLGDRFGRRRVFSMSLLLYALGTALLTAALHPAMLYIGVVLVGCAIGADLPVSLALIAEESPEGMKGRLIVFSGLLWVIGIIVTVILAAIVTPLGETAARILYGHLLLVAVIVLILRLGIRESAEWAAAKQAKGEGDEAIRFSALPQLFTPPLLSTVLALGLYYALWNLAANTFGQFGAFIFVNVVHASLQLQSLLGLALFPVGIGLALFFMRIVDKPSRKVWFTIGTICYVAAFATPALFGITLPTLITMMVLSGFGGSFCGEVIYKVWSQELVPTLLRSSGQGLTMAFARVLAALFAFITPTLIMANTRLFFGLLFALTLISGLIGLFWITRLPKARELEPEEALLVSEENAMRGQIAAPFISNSVES